MAKRKQKKPNYSQPLPRYRYLALALVYADVSAEAVEDAENYFSRLSLDNLHLGEWGNCTIQQGYQQQDGEILYGPLSLLLPDEPVPVPAPIVTAQPTLW